jgi:hypothetical protein
MSIEYIYKVSIQNAVKVLIFAQEIVIKLNLVTKFK